MLYVVVEVLVVVVTVGVRYCLCSITPRSHSSIVCVLLAGLPTHTTVRSVRILYKLWLQLFPFFLRLHPLQRKLFQLKCHRLCLQYHLVRRRQVQREVTTCHVLCVVGHQEILTWMMPVLVSLLCLLCLFFLLHVVSSASGAWPNTEPEEIEQVGIKCITHRARAV